MTTIRLFVESFTNETQQVKLRLSEKFSKATDLISGKEISGEKKEYFLTRRQPAIVKTVLNLELKPHSYMVLKLE